MKKTWKTRKITRIKEPQVFRVQISVAKSVGACDIERYRKKKDQLETEAKGNRNGKMFLRFALPKAAMASVRYVQYGEPFYEVDAYYFKEKDVIDLFKTVKQRFEHYSHKVRITRFTPDEYEILRANKMHFSLEAEQLMFLNGLKQNVK